MGSRFRFRCSATVVKLWNGLGLVMILHFYTLTKLAMIDPWSPLQTDCMILCHYCDWPYRIYEKYSWENYPHLWKGSGHDGCMRSLAPISQPFWRVATQFAIFIHSTHHHLGYTKPLWYTWTKGQVFNMYDRFCEWKSSCLDHDKMK